MKFTGCINHLIRDNIILFDIPIGELERQRLYKELLAVYCQIWRGKLGTDSVTTSNFGPHDFKRAQEPERFMECSISLKDRKGHCKHGLLC